MKQMGYLEAEGIKGKAQRGSASTLGSAIDFLCDHRGEVVSLRLSFLFGKIEK